MARRFRDAGFAVPKYMIEAKSRSLFEWSMLSLKGYQSAASKYIFIAMRDEIADVETFIQKQCSRMGILDKHMVFY